MEISNDKLNAYKELARKCESFDTFAWIVGLKEDWMTDMDINEAESALKNIYYDVHVNEQDYMLKYGKIASTINKPEEYLSDYEKMAAAIKELTKDWDIEKWDKAVDEGFIIGTYDDEYDLIKAVFPDANKDKLHDLSQVYEEAERTFLDENALHMVESEKIKM